jgi:hypothetical protein
MLCAHGAGFMRRHNTLAPYNIAARHSYCAFGQHYFVSKTGGFLYHHGDPRIILKMLELTNLKKGACSLDMITQVKWEHSIFYYETAVREVPALPLVTPGGRPCMQHCSLFRQAELARMHEVQAGF